MDKIIDLADVFGHKVDTPETRMRVSRDHDHFFLNLPSVAVAGGEAHEAVGQVVVVDEGAELAAHVW